MTTGELRDYLKGVIGAGVTVNNLDAVAKVAAESGYASVWGAYTWKIKRVQNDALSTTASQAYTQLPVDFESMLGIRIRADNEPVNVDIIPEHGFDESFPNPTTWGNDIPSSAKVVYSPANKWRIYWFPIPDAVYNLTVTYENKADIGNLPKLPSYMVDAVVAKAASLMFTGERRVANDQVAARALQVAITSDREVSGVASRMGIAPGWDDWDLVAKGTGNVWDPHVP